jgi:TRAP transporter TAXI family solute receptor
MKKKFALSILSIAMIFTVGCVASNAADTYLSIGTGGVTGVYYTLGGAIANIVSANMPGYQCTAESTGAAVENTMLISTNDIDIGFVDASTAYNAQNKLGAFADENITNLRGVISLYPEAVQVVTLSDSIKTIADLKGKSVAVGSPGSGSETMAKDLLALYGMTYDDIKEDFLGFGDAASGLKDNTIDAGLIWAGVPTSAIMELGAQHKISILNFTDEMFQKLKEIRPFCVPIKITREHYSSLREEEVNTVAIPATLQCRADLSEDFVYNFLTVLFDNLDTLAGAHARGGDVSLSSALNGMEKIELHPGAIKFYREKGVLK